jgi:hypothetical protein
MIIESFGQMGDNLMMVNAIVDSGGEIKIPSTFEEAASLASSLWLRKIQTLVKPAQSFQKEEGV